MPFTSEPQTPIAFIYLRTKTSSVDIEREEYFGTKVIWLCLIFFVFAFSAPPFSVGETCAL